jgi:hypothetical protein
MLMLMLLVLLLAPARLMARAQVFTAPVLAPHADGFTPVKRGAGAAAAAAAGRHAPVASPEARRELAALQARAARRVCVCVRARACACVCVRVRVRVCVCV